MTVAEFTWRWLQTYRKKRLNSILRTFALPGFGMPCAHVAPRSHVLSMALGTCALTPSPAHIIWHIELHEIRRHFVSGGNG